MERSGRSTAGRRTVQCRDPEAGISLKCLKKRETSVLGMRGRRLQGGGKGGQILQNPTWASGLPPGCSGRQGGLYGGSDMFWLLFKKLTQAVELRTDWGCLQLPATGS